jgi:uncharacterized protein (DUF736 family)
LSACSAPILTPPKSPFSRTRKAPFFTLVDEAGCELGIAFNLTGPKSGKEYISVKLDAPFWPAPVWASLFADKNGRHRR